MPSFYACFPPYTFCFDISSIPHLPNWFGEMGLPWWLRSLGQEDPLEKRKATHASILAWRILVDRGARQATVHGAQSQT